MHRLWLILIIIIYLFATLYQLELPGLHYDEAFEAVPTLQLLTNQPVTAFRESTLPLFGRQFPLTTQDYIGAINTYGTLPFLALGGLTVWSLRLYTVTLGVLTLILVCGFSQSLNRNAVAGLVAAALLVVNPTFIFLDTPRHLCDQRDRHHRDSIGLELAALVAHTSLSFRLARYVSIRSWPICQAAVYLASRGTDVSLALDSYLYSTKKC